MKNLRNLYVYVWIAVAAVYVSACSRDAEIIYVTGDVDVYLCMGQSNMVGYTNYATFYMPVANACVYSPSANSWVAPLNPISAYNVLGDKPGAKIGVPYGFMLEMSGYRTGRKTAVVLAAYGGKGIDTFLPGNGSGYYSEAIKAVRAAMSHGGRLCAVLWHQGESDSGAGMRYLYGGKLSTLVEALRSDLGIPDLPFVAGEVMEDARTRAYDDFSAFNVVLNSVAADIPGVRVVQSDGLVGQDGAHFDAESMITLGRRYAVEVRSIPDVAGE
ncbi:MAG: sialate O-acetylesterase [Tannerellaceae bacterium]|jgi:hypothetical protein|nr:sialate O-acetylesterase [Tannerellaceae bacterium]